MGNLPLGRPAMQDIIYIRYQLVLKAHADGPYILLGRGDGPDATRISRLPEGPMPGSILQTSAESWSNG